MKKKLIFTCCAILLLNIFPLLFKPALIFHFKTFVLIIAAAILWLSQPAFSKNEMHSDRKTDRLSLLIILLASSISVFAAVAEWAWFNEQQSVINGLTMTGLILIVSGIVLRVWSINLLGRNFTATVKITNEHELITKGPYHIVRHPSYLGALIAITGCPLFLNDRISSVIAIFAMMVAYYLRISFEEKTLLKHFGKSYADYSKTTYRLFPLIW